MAMVVAIVGSMVSLIQAAQLLSAGQPRQALAVAQAAQEATPTPQGAELAAAAALRLGDTGAALGWLEALPHGALFLF